MKMIISCLMLTILCVGCSKSPLSVVEKCANAVLDSDSKVIAETFQSTQAAMYLAALKTKRAPVAPSPEERAKIKFVYEEVQKEKVPSDAVAAYVVKDANSPNDKGLTFYVVKENDQLKCAMKK